MAQVRIKRDGTKTVANTIYLRSDTDHKAKQIARQRSRTREGGRRWSKSAVIVHTVETNL